jgi:hypothetical protein
MAGCTAWEPIGVGPSELIQGERPESIRVHYADGQQVVLSEPSLRNDSIIDLSSARCSTGSCDGPRAAPLEGITTVEVRRVSVGRTVLNVVGGMAAVFVIGLLTWASDSGSA